MKIFPLTAVILAISVLTAACSTTPTTTTLLDQTRSDFQRAQNNPKVATFAPLEMKQASDALTVANASAANNDNAEVINRLAYVAKQKIATAEEAAKQKSAEADIANASKERDQVRLDQRTSEVTQAKNNADQARLATQIAQGETAEARRLAEEAQRQSLESQNRANLAEQKLAQQLSELAAKQTERGIIITIGDVLFGTDQHRLTPDGLRTTQKLADIMQQNPQRMVLVEGFTDSVGTSDYNQALSERRAMAVRSALQLQGVAKERIAVRGYGESYPVASNSSASDRQLNRRVEIVLSDASGKINPR